MYELRIGMMASTAEQPQDEQRVGEVAGGGVPRRPPPHDAHRHPRDVLALAEEHDLVLHAVDEEGALRHVLREEPEVQDARHGDEVVRHGRTQRGGDVRPPYVDGSLAQLVRR
eukprot:CAMPEP_0113291380 /NCGR_PEP_ID=MMETSP0008_2-20120614/34024_1 /TAXON_ID=97485 /ORGANISM="Prymnesium parvum" /LENGTH=112 /DNA_ID=CAMNT_0000143301 /DNA_START=578 /DNA_END=914 /DNA_ORIENTATION=+ /assembly_acc=CAM_ASM_000153